MTVGRNNRLQFLQILIFSGSNFQSCIVKLWEQIRNNILSTTGNVLPIFVQIQFVGDYSDWVILDGTKVSYCRISRFLARSNLIIAHHLILGLILEEFVGIVHNFLWCRFDTSAFRICRVFTGQMDDLVVKCSFICAEHLITFHLSVSFF